MNDQERKELEEALYNFLSSDQAEQEEPKQAEGEESLKELMERVADVGTSNWNKDNTDILEQEVGPHIEAIRKVCEREKMSFVFFTVKRFEDGAYELHSEVGLYTKICEVLACLAVINLPHDISHQVINAAAVLAKMLGINPFLPLGKEEEDFD